VDHIFRDAPGHLPDTPENRELLQHIADDPATTLGVDKFGNTWSARTLDDGTQAWTQTRNRAIINGGVNPTPRPFNPQTGLSRQRPPHKP
jgi:filamentous hemagglutinin